MRGVSHSGISPEQLREIIHEEVPGIVREIIREEVPKMIREELGSIREAILVLADNLPGQMPAQRSHVRTEVEKALAS